MRLFLMYSKVITLESVRLPAFILPIIAFPLMLFWFFGVPYADDPRAANFTLSSFAAFAVLGVVLFQFGASIALDRETPWERYVRALPSSAVLRFAARLVSASVIAIICVIPLALLGMLTTPVSIGLLEWVRVTATLLVGGLPFAALGTALGYWVSARGAVPVTNLVFLPLAYGGGMLQQPGSLPELVARISPFLPTRQWNDLVHEAAFGVQQSWSSWLSLGIYTVLFSLFALWGYRRDEGRKYR
jgi:ABC-2 type transport system permease protein